MNESPPEHTQIVVIGGGIMGCSTAYHLTKNGCRDVIILLERGKLTSGTTWQRFPAQATLEASCDSENVRPRM